MATELLLFAAKQVRVLDVSLHELIDAIRTLALEPHALDPYEAVAVFARFVGGWYVYEVRSFLTQSTAFSVLTRADQDEDAIKRLFEIHEHTQVPVIAPGEPPGEPAVVLNNGEFVGLWARSQPGNAQKIPVADRIPHKPDDWTLSVHEDSPATDFCAEMSPRPNACDLERPAVLETFLRTPHLDVNVASCPPAGQEFEVTVYCDTSKARDGERSDPISILAPPRQHEFHLEVFLSPCIGLRVSGPSSQELVLQRNVADSARIRFRVTVEAAPPAEGAALNAYFFYNGRPCGSVTRILPTTTGAPPVEPSGQLAVIPGIKAADLTVSVTRCSGSVACYKLKLTSPHLTAQELGEPGLWDLGEPPQNYIAALFKNFIRNRNDPTNRLATLRGAGESLFEATPKNFRACYERLVGQGKLKTILIVSDEPYIPWELMVPPTTREQRLQGLERDPLGVAHAVGRWISDEHLSPFPSLRVGRMMVVAPDYKDTALKVLAQSEEEAGYLQRRFNATVIHPSVYATIVSTLKAQPPHLFHFIGHGNSSPEAPAQCLHLEDKDSLSPDVVRGETAFKQAFAQQTPVVFLNACEVGQQTLSLGGPAGFVPTFIKLFASCVIAPLWSVRDSLAHEVAQALYDAAIPQAGSPVPVAEVLRQIRERTYRGPSAGEDTYAAYCFYGDPNFVIDLPQAQRSDTWIAESRPSH